MAKQLSLDDMPSYSHDQLVDLARQWLMRQGCQIVITEMTTEAMEEADAIGWSSGWSRLVECKVSRSDFRADRQKPFRRMPDWGMGEERYYLVPDGLIAVDEVPPGWGLLEVFKGRVFKRLASKHFEADCRRELLLLTSAIRRLAQAVGTSVQPPGISCRMYMWASNADCTLGVNVNEECQEHETDSVS